MQVVGWPEALRSGAEISEEHGESTRWQEDVIIGHPWEQRYHSVQSTIGSMPRARTPRSWSGRVVSGWGKGFLAWVLQITQYYE